MEERTTKLNDTVAVLRTAVFNESHPSPDCNNGTLDLETPTARAKRVTCDSCDFAADTELY
jgi:hypothetical protein